MNIWKNELMSVLHELFANPATTTEELILTSSAAIACVIALRLMSSAFGLQRSEWWRILFVLIATTTLSFAAVIAVRLYLLDVESSAALRMSLQIGAAILVVLTIGVPLQIFLQNGSYMGSFLAFGTTVVVSALITAGVYTTYHSVKADGKTTQHAKDRIKESLLEANIPVP